MSFQATTKTIAPPSTPARGDQAAARHDLSRPSCPAVVVEGEECAHAGRGRRCQVGVEVGELARMADRNGDLAHDPARPSREDDDRSARNTASGIEWVTRTMLVPVSRQTAWSWTLNRSRVRASSALNGSSRSRTAGRSAMARAIAARWRMPPDS